MLLYAQILFVLHVASRAYDEGRYTVVLGKVLGKVRPHGAIRITEGNILAASGFGPVQLVSLVLDASNPLAQARFLIAMKKL